MLNDSVATAPVMSWPTTDSLITTTLSGSAPLSVEALEVEVGLHSFTWSPFATPVKLRSPYRGHGRPLPIGAVQVTINRADQALRQHVVELPDAAH